MRAYETLPGSRVLLAADDRRFRALAATLLSRRGYAVSVCSRRVDLVEVTRRESVDVVVLDASASLTAAARVAARLSTLEPPVAIVAVSTDAHPGLAALPVVSKWGPAEALFAAIERACQECASVSHRGATAIAGPESMSAGEVTRVAS